MYIISSIATTGLTACCDPAIVIDQCSPLYISVWLCSAVAVLDVTWHPLPWMWLYGTVAVWDDHDSESVMSEKLMMVIQSCRRSSHSSLITSPCSPAHGSCQWMLVNQHVGVSVWTVCRLGRCVGV